MTGRELLISMQDSLCIFLFFTFQKLASLFLSVLLHFVFKKLHIKIFKFLLAVL